MALVIVACQFAGCAGKDSNEISNKVKNGEEIVIQVEAINYDIQGELSVIDWTELQKKYSNENSREFLDGYFSNYADKTGTKYGPFYIDKDNNQEGNNTLFTVLGNEYVANTLSTLINTPNKEIAQYLNKDYADLEESDYTSAMFNAYFELIPDSTPNYFNGGASLSRAEAMALVMRAVTPVGTLEPDEAFETAVTGTDTSDTDTTTTTNPNSYTAYTPYASKEDSNSYISTSDNSLNSDNYAGAMTRAEYVYLVLNEIYGTEAVQSQSISSNQDTVTRGVSEIQDCKLNSKIADTLKLTPTSNQYHSACLQYALQNTDKGVPEELYKAIVMAYEKNIISAETRWDEAITKTDAIEILISTMQAYYKENGYPYNNADKGSTVSLEADAKALWEKQDKNDMSCTEEEFIEDYVTLIGNGSMTPEEFEEIIERNYSISLAEKHKELIEEQEEDTTEEHDEQKENDEQQSPESNNISNNNGNSSSGNNTPSGNSGNNNSNNNTSYEEPVYNPPVDNSGSSSNYVEPVYQEPVYTPPVDNTPAQ